MKLAQNTAKYHSGGICQIWRKIRKMTKNIEKSKYQIFCTRLFLSHLEVSKLLKLGDCYQFTLLNLHILVAKLVENHSLAKNIRK